VRPRVLLASRALSLRGQRKFTGTWAAHRAQSITLAAHGLAPETRATNWHKCSLLPSSGIQKFPKRGTTCIEDSKASISPVTDASVGKTSPLSFSKARSSCPVRPRADSTAFSTEDVWIVRMDLASPYRLAVLVTCSTECEIKELSSTRASALESFGCESWEAPNVIASPSVDPLCWDLSTGVAALW